MNHAERKHAKFSASSAHRWLVCAGYAGLAARVPPAPSGAAARKGTEAHEVLERALRSGAVNAYAFLGPELDYLECVQTVLDYVYELRRDDPAWELLIETAFDLTPFVNGECGGVADVVLWHPKLRELRVIDMKTGTRPVFAEANVQELTYAAGVAFDLKLAPRKVVLVIIGTRFLGRVLRVQEWETDSVTLADFVGTIEAAIGAARMPDPDFTPGEHCEYCPAEHVCPARERYALAMLNENYKTVRAIDTAPLPDPATLDPARISFILQHRDRLTDWLDAVRAFAEAELRAGRGASAPGFKLVEAQPRRKWQGETEEIGAALAKLSGAPFDTFVQPELIGITEATKQITKWVRDAGETAGLPKKEITRWVTEAKEKLAFLTERQSSGNLTLVPDTDPRPAFSLTGDAFVGVDVLPATD